METTTSTDATLAPPPTPRSVAAELLHADRAFAAMALNGDLASAFALMFADEVIIPLPNGEFARSKTQVIAARRDNPENATQRVTWQPLRVGVSAEGQHGLTFGIVQQRNSDESIAAGRYISYWIKQARGWQVVAYKRSQVVSQKVDESQVSKAAPSMFPPLLPGKLVSATRDAATLGAYYRDLIAREGEFSERAAVVGLGVAFQQFGSADAVNIGAPTDANFIVGADAIGRSVVGHEPVDAPSTLVWSADTAFVASSGDLGVTFGRIRYREAASGAPTPVFSFFTVWHRASPTKPWRYIAE